MDRHAADEHHWATVSLVTQLSGARRPGTSGGSTRWRVRLGLALVRAGLAIAPLGAPDLQRSCARPGAT